MQARLRGTTLDQLRAALGPVDFTPLLVGPRKLAWIVFGAESGPHRRPYDPAWLDDLAEQCARFRTALFVKQGSRYFPGRKGDIPDPLWAITQYPRTPVR